jgi:hypothetical protein
MQTRQSSATRRGYPECGLRQPGHQRAISPEQRAETPHGGFKNPGYGKDLSMYGFEDYTRVKHGMSYFGD